MFYSPYLGLFADPAPAPLVFGSAVTVALDIPLLTDDTESAQLWFASFAEPWPGSVAVFGGASADGLSIQRQSLIGQLMAPLSPGCGGRWDRASALHVQLPAGALESFTEEEVLAGGHLCAVEVDGGWELLQFRDADLQPDGTWRLSHLLRGRRGTDQEAATGAPAGAQFILLTDATPIALSADLWGTTFQFEAGPEGAERGAYPFRSSLTELTGSGARPLAPVHLKTHASSGSVDLTWIRRTRIGGGQFGPGDVPLGETTELYHVELLDGSDEVLESFSTSEPNLTFVQGQATKVTVAQCSSAYGRGRAAALSLS